MTDQTPGKQAGLKPAQSLFDWPSAPAAGTRARAQRWPGQGVRMHPAMAGTAWVVTGAALFALYVASWRYFPY